MKFIHAGNALINPEKIVCIYQDDEDKDMVRVLFENGEKLNFHGKEAAELWRALDPERDWKDENT